MGCIAFKWLNMVVNSMASIEYIAFIGGGAITVAMYYFGYFEDKISYHNNSTQAKRLCSNVFSRVEKEFFSLGGEFNSAFYNNVEIRSNLNNIIQKGVVPRLLFGPNFDIESVDLLKLKLGNKIQIRRLKKKQMGDHFKVADSKFVYVAKPHVSLGDDKSGFILSSIRDASKKKILFETLWESAEEFDVVDKVRSASVFQPSFLEPKWLEKNPAEWGIQSGFIKMGEDSKARPANAEEIISLKEKLGIA